MNALFIMCTALKKEVEELRAEVKALRDARHAPKQMLESMNHLSEDIESAVDFQVKEIARLETDLNEVREHVKVEEGSRRITVQKIKALETAVYNGKGKVFSVQNSSRHQKPQYNRPHQFRERICYNCRRPGHEARNCNKPNPRLNATPNLSEEKAQALSVNVQNPSVSRNPRLAGYDMSNLGINVTPCGSEVKNLIKFFGP